MDWRAEERLPIIRMLTLADYFSLANGMLGLLAIIAALGGQVRLTFTLLVVAGLLDGADGYMARRGYGGGRLGGKLDSFCDLVSFVVAPALLFWSVYGEHVALPTDAASARAFLLAFLVISASAFYFLTGLLRLARFDYLKGGERHDYFIGVTTPGAASVIISMSLLDWDLAPALFTIVLMAILMTSRVRLPKLRGLLAAAAAGTLLAAAVIGDAWNGLGAILLLVFFLAYLVLGPVYVRRHVEEDAEPTL